MKQINLLPLIVIILMYISRATFAQQTCDYKVEMLIDGEEFQKEDFKWRIRATKIEGAPTNITGIAEIEDSNGTNVKSYKPWTLEPISKQKTSGEYTTKLKEGAEYEINARIYVGCDDTNMGNNMDIKKIRIKSKNNNNKVEETKTKKSQSAMLNTSGGSEGSEETGNVIHVIHSANKIVYESSNEKAKSIIMISLLALSILLNIVLIWKR